MGKNPETRLTDTIKGWVENHGGFCIKLHGNEMQESGLPDIHGAIKVTGEQGTHIIHFWVELKVGDNQPSKIQQYQLKRIGKYDFAVGVAYSLEDFKLIIQGNYLSKIGYQWPDATLRAWYIDGDEWK